MSLREQSERQAARKRRVVNNNLKQMAYTETLFSVIDEFGECAKPSAEDLTRYANRINSLQGLIANCTSYNIRRRTWYMMPHKEMVYCVNMKKIKIKNKYKLKK